MRFATVEHGGRTLVVSVDKSGEKVSPLSVGDINAVFRGERYTAAGPQSWCNTSGNSWCGSVGIR